MPLSQPQQKQRQRDDFETRRQEQFAAMVEISRAFADVPDEELELELARAQAEARNELRAEDEPKVPDGIDKQN